MQIALYIHIPFCARKCAYCDFASFEGRLGELPGYLRQLEQEMDRYERLEPKTVFIGGGTPSLMSGEQAQRLMDAVRAHFSVPPDAEISIEANPGTLDAGKLNAYRAAGINRLSLGVQAKQPHLLKMLGRIHSWADAVRGVDMARGAGFMDINLDLMYALPGQTMPDWLDTLESAIALAPTHVSAYSLILEPGTRLTDQVEHGELRAPDEDIALDMQRAATRALAGAGLERYEISNYARPGHECRHNITYWTRGDYLGLGAAAHSLIRGERFSNSEQLVYSPLAHQTLSAEDIWEESVMLQTRMTRGIALDGLAPERVDKLAALGLVHADASRLILTERGMELHNQVVLVLLD